MCTIGPLRFIGFFARFRRERPGIDLSLVEGTPARLLQMMDQGELDVAIMAKPDPFEDRFHVRPLYEEPFCVAFAAGHRFEERNTVRVADMDGESYLSRLNCEYYDQLDDGLRSARARVNEVFRSEREDWIQVMVSAGLGICFVPVSLPITRFERSDDAVRPPWARQ
jgi:DNA-binding transcriptional LysR family regulator